MSGSGCVRTAETKSAVSRDRAVQSRFLTVKKTVTTDICGVSPPFVIYNLRLLRLRRLAFPKKKKKKKVEEEKGNMHAYKNLHDSYSHTHTHRDTDNTVLQMVLD